MLASLLASVALQTTPDEFLNQVRDFNVCVRRVARQLEPSGDSPSDIAVAATYHCMDYELLAINTSLRLYGEQPDGLRETARFFGAAEATTARACRVARVCSLNTAPTSVE